MTYNKFKSFGNEHYSGIVTTFHGSDDCCYCSSYTNVERVTNNYHEDHNVIFRQFLYYYLEATFTKLSLKSMFIKFSIIMNNDIQCNIHSNNVACQILYFSILYFNLISKIIK